MYSGIKPLLKPTVDVVFKALFGQESSKELLISFLQSVLQWEELESIIYLDPIFKIEDIDDKSPILDIKAKTPAGEYLNIEIQVAYQKHFSNRSLYYWARIYGNQLLEGQGYDALKKTICINILDFNHFEEHENYHSIYKIKEEFSNKLLTNHLEIHFIELSKFIYNENEVINSDNIFYQWLYFIKNAHKMSLEGVASMKDSVKDAYQKLSVISSDEILRLRYEARRMGELDQQQRIADAIEEAVKDAEWNAVYSALKDDLIDQYQIDINDYYSKLKNLDREKVRQLRRTWRNSLKSQIICELDNL